MGIEGSRRKENPEDPNGKGIEAGAEGIEFNLGRERFFPFAKPATRKDTPLQAAKERIADPNHCSLVLTFRSPQRYGHGRTEIVIPRVPLIDANYEGFKVGMMMAGFKEHAARSVYRLPEEGSSQNALGSISKGDFKRLTSREKEALKDGKISFPDVMAEEYLFDSFIGFGNYVIFTQGANEDEGRFVLADLHKKLQLVLQKYPLKRIVQNPHSPYLKTD